jgi:hypothetical protein
MFQVQIPTSYQLYRLHIFADILLLTKYRFKALGEKPVEVLFLMA